MTTELLVLIGQFFGEACDLVLKTVIDGVKNETHTHAHAIHTIREEWLQGLCV